MPRAAQFHRDEFGGRYDHALLDGGLRRRDARFLRQLGDAGRGVLADRSPGTTISAVGSGKLAVSQRIPAMNSVPRAAWADDMTGMDNAPAIQAALDFGMRESYPDFKFPNGVFAVTSSLNAGWGKGLDKLNINGDYRELIRWPVREQARCSRDSISPR